MKKRVLAWVLALGLLLGLTPGNAWAAEETTAQVSFTAQAEGEFLFAPRFDVEVAGNLAESYGYTDSVTDGVSALDVLVKAHEVVFGAEFTPETANTMLVVGDGGWITTLFGTETSYSGFILNGMYPHDGTEAQWGGYNGTTVTTQEVADGDQVDFFFYQDTSYYMDMLTWLCRDGQVVDTLTVMPGEQVALELKGYSYMYCYNFVDADALHEAGNPVCEMQLAWVDVSTGEATPIPDCLTDSEDGSVTVTMPDTEGVYYLSVDGTATDDSDSPCIMSLLPVTVVEPDAWFTVPSDATLFVGSKSNHFVPFEEIAPMTRTDNGDGTATYAYLLETGSAYNFRVSGENYVTYGGTFTKTDDFTKTVTQADLTPEGKTRATVERDVTANDGYNVADIYLNINPQGYLNLASGETYQIVNLRNWEAVNSTTANYFIEPDYHYAVVDETGAASDVVTVSDSGLLTAQKAGTAIVLVTYDAMQMENAAGGPFFGAIWPENTGVFVVSVDAPDSGIETGMTLNEGKNTDATAGKQALDALDAEHDVIYFLGETGSYTFTPKTAGCAVEVANPTVGETLTFTGFVPVEADEDGSVAVPLVQGRNIVKLTKDGKSTYQVVTAKRVTVSGVPEKATPGQEISLTFDTLYHPANKLAGVYNMYAVAVYSDVDGYEGKLVGGAANQYQFASTAAAQTVNSVVARGTDNWGGVKYTQEETFTIPEDWTEDTFTLSGGALIAYGYGDPFGNHRGITLTEGKAPNLNAGVTEAYLGSLPDIVIPVETAGGTDTSTPTPSGVTVKFTLLGDENHDSDTDKQVHTLKGGNLTVWLEETSVKVDAGATVFDVIEKALAAEGIDYEEDGSDAGYITSVRGLGELDNGANSGWMYTLNGSYPTKGIKEQTVKSGDKVILHYTDDWTAEATSMSSSDTAKPSSSTGTASRSEDAAESETSPEEAEPETGGGTTVKTDVAEVTWYAGLEKLAEEAGETVTVTAEAGEDGAVKIAVTVGDKAVERVPGGLTVKIPGEGLAPGNVLALVGEDGSETIVKKSVVSETGVTALLDGPATVRIVDNSKEFDDVGDGHWAKDAVAFAASHELFQGTGERLFSPDMGMDRAMVVTVLYRLEDASASGETAFPDVESGSWYADAVTWAAASGIVAGDGAGFAPHRAVTRQELAAMLYRYARDAVTAEAGDLTAFADGDAVADWASDAMAWAVGAGLLQGKTGNVLDPAGNATRGEVAAVLERLVRLMVR